MDDHRKDDIPMLSASDWPSDRHEYYPKRRFNKENRSVSITIPVSTTESNSGAASHFGFSGSLHNDKKSPKEPVEQELTDVYKHQWEKHDEVKNEHLMRSGQLGLCNDPYCTTCPSAYNYKGQMLISRVSQGLDHSLLVYGGAKGWMREKLSLLKHFIFGVMNPHAKIVQQWNQFIVISCLLAIFIDPLFFYLLSVNKNNKCIVINWPMTKAIVAFRSITDFIYLMHMLVQFRLAFVSPESRVVGAGDLVDNPRKIALHYLSGFFPLDLFIVLPLPQIIVLLILPNSIASSGANYAKNLLRAAVLVQYIPRLYRFLPLLAGQSPSGFIFESAWANFVINLLTFVLAGHVVGACWYLFGLQIIVLLILPNSIASSGANYAKNLLRAAVLVQYIPRLYRFLPLLAGQSPSGFIFESAWANFVINLLTFVLAGHVVGACWYLFGLQRVNQCLRRACHNSGFENCKKFIDCGHGNDFGSFEGDPKRNDWTKHVNATACFSEDGFSYGIYIKAVNLTATDSIVTRYVYSFFWGFQQISTLAGNQVPSYFEWEVLFTMGIIGLGLLLFALLIGNMQNFLQGLGRRRLEMSLRRRDVEQWMSHRHLPEDLRRKVRDSERYNWAATQGVNEEMLMENFPEDLQRDIRRHLFKFVKKVRIFSVMDEPFLDAICERLRQKTYIKGGTILYQGGFVTKMLFIVRGKMESTGEDGSIVPLCEGDACGEELLRWCLEHSSINGGRSTFLDYVY
ncbi:hypothetical protein CTI12_AA041140 [Artemisia annua]|uniref:Cyclic nucleotide-binding domain-containing protein n=1 Tax=Artemisia annua TaxID=35608 RepID=A0A2U1PAP5_ARTAN|nr:hypothetical protein CTI12_AA041140 [Artemisia annua]